MAMSRLPLSCPPRRATDREESVSDQCSIEAVYPASLGWLIRMEMGVPGMLPSVSNRVACETLDAMCTVCKVHCATWRTEDADGCWTRDACDDSGQGVDRIRQRRPMQNLILDMESSVSETCGRRRRPAPSSDC
ncbi:MAG: hypothetical protein O7D91_17830 [Planctomycetota bacterium]|nr:hypothetical protein [Planctomycetota bacterium]